MIYQGSKGYPVHELVIHTTATPKSWMAGKSAEAKVAEIDRWHREERGWRGIGYHWIIDRDGRIAAGRPETDIGAHVSGHNKGTIGVALVGGFGGAADDFFVDHYTPEQRRALWKFIRGLAERTELSSVTGHNQYSPKACPCFRVPLEFPWPPVEEPVPVWQRLTSFFGRWL